MGRRGVDARHESYPMLGCEVPCQVAQPGLMRSACFICQGSPWYGSGRVFIPSSCSFAPMFGVESRWSDLVRFVRHDFRLRISDIEQMGETCHGSASGKVGPCTSSIIVLP